jgi:Mg2+ and Co2+ transporter CorA
LQNETYANINEGSISEASIPGWIAQSRLKRSPTECHALRLLIGSPEAHNEKDAEMLPLPMSRRTYELICGRLSLPSEFLRMMLSTLPLVPRFDPIDADGQQWKGLMVRSGRSRDWNFCLGILHNTEAGVTVGILNGLQSPEIEKLLQCLRNSKSEAVDPMLVPALLLELKVNHFAKLLEKRALGLEAIEYATGMRHGFSEDPKRNALIDEWRRENAKKLDFDPITQKLTGVTGTLSFCDMTFQSSRRALDAVAGFRRECAASPTRLQQSKHSDSSALTRRVDYLYELIEGSLYHSAVLSARTKAQIQTVYSMIGQRDNRVNIEAAKASQKIAILTRRDSLDMRIIAAVTLVFLPGTFIATMFGAGFFKFFPEGSHSVVSRWIWLYFVLTVGVTMIVLGLWWFFSRKKSLLLHASDVESGSQILKQRARQQSTSTELQTMRVADKTVHPALNTELSHTSSIDMMMKS